MLGEGADLSVINSGDSAWMLVSTALVLLMTPGVCFFYWWVGTWPMWTAIVRAPTQAKGARCNEYMQLCYVHGTRRARAPVVYAVVQSSSSTSVSGVYGNQQLRIFVSSYCKDGGRTSWLAIA